MNRVVSIPRREKLLRAALLGAGISAALGAIAAIETGVRLTDPELMVRRRGLQRYHPLLGWENRPGARSTEPGATVSLDERGRRRSGVSGAPPSSRVHLLLLGDSVAFGLGVADEETFAASLSQGARAYRVTNLAVPGYGPGQSLLRYESVDEGDHAEIVVFALCLGNDLADTLSLSHLYDDRVPKPRFVLRQGVLALESAHVRRARIRGLLDRSFLFARLGAPMAKAEQTPRQVERRLEALRLHSRQAEDTLVEILARMRRSAEGRGARFLVAAFPDERALDPSSVRWPSLREKLRLRVDVLDLAPVLAPDRVSYTRHSLDHIGHLSRRGHEQAARALRERLSGPW